MNSERHRFQQKISVPVLIISFLAIAGFAALPPGLFYLGQIIAKTNGCVLHGGDSHPCVVLGVDLGGFLYATLYMGYVSIPFFAYGALALAVWVVAAGWELFKWFIRVTA